MASQCFFRGMMAAATTRAQNVWTEGGGQDYLQLLSPSGQILSWIDSTGTGRGNLASSGGIGGSISAGQIAVGSGTNAIGGSSNLTYSAGFLQLTSTSGMDITDQSSGGITIAISGGGTGEIIIRADAASTAGINIENDGTGGSSGITIQNTAAGGGGIGITDNSATGITIQSTGAGGVFIQANSGAGGISLTTASGTGALALTTNATGGLTINGSTGFTHASSDYTAFTFTNGIVTAATPSSDERIKKQIKPFMTGLDAVLQIQPITYWWAENSGIVSDHEWVGFSAQNVQKVIPVATPVDPQTGYLEFNDKGVIAALVNAVKELLERIQKLEQELSELRPVL